MADTPDPRKDKDQKPNFLNDLEKKLRNGAPQGEPPKGGNGKIANRIALFLLLGLALASVFYFTPQGKPTKSTVVPYSEFIDDVKKHLITQCKIVNNEKIIFSRDAVAYETKIPYQDPGLITLLQEHKVVYEGEQVEESKILLALLSWLPWVVLMLVFYFLFMRQFRGRNGGAFSFGRSKAKLVNEADIKVTFKDVEGCEEAKTDLQEIISFLKDPKKYTEIGAKIPKGVLLVGPPGTGKTLLAKAVAGEAKVPFFSMSGSDFVEMFVGVGASRVRDLFENGKKNAPCILFIDEIDAVGRTRGAGYGGGHDEREQTLNQLLVEMDGFDTNEAVIIMAATNRADVLDKALLRPGRFDRQVVVDVPDVKGRLGILTIHAKKIKLTVGSKLEDLARGTPGFTGADLANVINEAALLAAREGRKEVLPTDLERAKDKVMMGTERRSMLISPDEKKLTAYHEAGHALVSMMTGSSQILHKVSIIPRGRALGITAYLPEDGKHTMSLSKLKAELRVLYGGRVAEELIFKDFTNGASNDIERATRIARAMVCEWGMSRLGAISFGEKDQPVFIGREVTRQDDFSDQTAMIIDTEVKRILDEAYKETLRLLKSNLGKLKLLAEELLHKETMDSDEIYSLLKMKKPVSEKMDLGDGNEPPKTSPIPPKETKEPAASIFHPEPPPLPT